MFNKGIMFVVFASLFISAACDKKGQTMQASTHNGPRPKAKIETTLGGIAIEFYPDLAPKTVENFLKLSKEGFYNGTTFHRVIPGFMIQGGDPNSKQPDRSKHGTGGPGYSIKAEFNSQKHVRGVLSMARSSHPDSAGSQFFIMVADSPHLDGQYTAFGKVISGLEVVDKIVAAKRDPNDNPFEKIEIQKITVE